MWLNKFVVKLNVCAKPHYSYTRPLYKLNSYPDLYYKPNAPKMKIDANANAAIIPIINLIQNSFSFEL